MHTAFHGRFANQGETTKYDANSTRRQMEIQILRNSHNDTMALQRAANFRANRWNK